MSLRRPTVWFVALVACVLGVSLATQTSLAPPEVGDEKEVIELISQRRVVPLDRELPLTKSSRFQWILGDGFEEAEADGTWIMALEATIEFSTTAGREPKEAIVRMLPLVSRLKPTRSFRFESSADSETVTVDEQVPLLEIALKLDRRPDQQLRIICDELVSPSFLKIGPDRRPMCAKVLSVRVAGN